MNSIFSNYNFISDINLENQFSNNNQWLMSGRILSVSENLFYCSPKLIFEQDFLTD